MGSWKKPSIPRDRGPPRAGMTSLLLLGNSPPFWRKVENIDFLTLFSAQKKKRYFFSNFFRRRLIAPRRRGVTGKVDPLDVGGTGQDLPGKKNPRRQVGIISIIRGGPCLPEASKFHTGKERRHSFFGHPSEQIHWPPAGGRNGGGFQSKKVILALFRSKKY